jgi:hypothetical protein
VVDDASVEGAALDLPGSSHSALSASRAATVATVLKDSQPRWMLQGRHEGIGPTLQLLISDLSRPRGRPWTRCSPLSPPGSGSGGKRAQQSVDVDLTSPIGVPRASGFLKSRPSVRFQRALTCLRADLEQQGIGT